MWQILSTLKWKDAKLFIFYWQMIPLLFRDASSRIIICTDDFKKIRFWNHIVCECLCIEWACLSGPDHVFQFVPTLSYSKCYRTNPNKSTPRKTVLLTKFSAILLRNYSILFIFCHRNCIEIALGGTDWGRRNGRPCSSAKATLCTLSGIVKEPLQYRDGKLWDLGDAKVVCIHPAW